MSAAAQGRCSFVPCERPCYAGGLCHMHYLAEQAGEPLYPLRRYRPRISERGDDSLSSEGMKSMREDFPTLLRLFRERAGRSRNNLAHQVGVDPSYLTRIEHGDREPPRQHIVEALARCLRLTISERNRLLVSGGYAPLSVMQLGVWDDALQAVADVLNDVTLSDEERDQFRSVVQMISGRWRGSTEVRALPV